MTADEFRGFVANLSINAILIAILCFRFPHLPSWAYVLITIGLIVFFPIPTYRSKPKDKP